MESKRIIYYEDELNDEFSGAEIKARVIDENYKYIHKNVFWNISSFLVNFILFFVKRIYLKIKFKIKYIGKEKLKKYKNSRLFCVCKSYSSFSRYLYSKYSNEIKAKLFYSKS